MEKIAVEIINLDNLEEGDKIIIIVHRLLDSSGWYWPTEKIVRVEKIVRILNNFYLIEYSNPEGLDGLFVYKQNGENACLDSEGEQMEEFKIIKIIKYLGMDKYEGE